MIFLLTPGWTELCAVTELEPDFQRRARSEALRLATTSSWLFSRWLRPELRPSADQWTLRRFSSASRSQWDPGLR